MARTKYSGVYEIWNCRTGIVYVGSAGDIQTRLNAHFADLARNKHHNTHLQNSYNKYGRQAFIAFAVEHCDRAILAEREQSHMDRYTEAQKYNIFPFARSAAGMFVGSDHYAYGLSKYDDRKDLIIDLVKSGVPIRRIATTVRGTASGVRNYINSLIRQGLLAAADLKTTKIQAKHNQYTRHCMSALKQARYRPPVPSASVLFEYLETHTKAEAAIQFNTKPINITYYLKKLVKEGMPEANQYLGHRRPTVDA